MDIKTIEDDFEPKKSFSDWLWDNKEELGEAVYIKIDEYFGIDDLSKNLD